MKYKYIKKNNKTSQYYFYLVIILTSFFINIKETTAQISCSTPSTSSISPRLENNVRNLDPAGPFYIRIYVHVIRNAQGLGGQSVQDVNDALAFLDDAFNQHNIFFIQDCPIDYIDNDFLFEKPRLWVFDINNHYDGIDIYLFDDTSFDPGGRANGVGNSSELWVSGTYDGIEMVKTHIISHEMGHVLNLFHTHHQCDADSDAPWELIDGSNCSIAGDFVCDTPPDPSMFFNVDANTCEWDGNIQCLDIPPEPIANYDPDEKNIMSYNHPNCSEYFTIGQGQRMRNSIASLPFLQATLTNATPPVNDIVHAGIISQGIYEASNTITSTGTIDSDQCVIYRAGKNICLNDVFLADGSNGSVFLATISECDNSSVINLANNPVQELSSTAPKQTNEVTSFSVTNYPNPFTGETTIEFVLLEDTPVSLIVFDAMGKELMILLNRKQKIKGTHQVIFDGKTYPAGMYYYTIQAGNYVATKKMILAK